MKTMTKDEQQESFDIARLTVMPVDCPIRVERKLARKWLLDNKTIICGGIVFYLKIRNIGLGVCEVAKADKAWRKTQMCKKFV